MTRISLYGRLEVKTRRRLIASLWQFWD